MSSFNEKKSDIIDRRPILSAIVFAPALFLFIYLSLNFAPMIDRGISEVKESIATSIMK